MMQVPITRPYIGEEEKRAVAEVLDSGWLIQGSKVEEFERMVARYAKVEYAKACSNCTTALHMALVALGLDSFDESMWLEVIVPAYTFVASANAVEYTGAKPVFVDIDLDTFNIDAKKLEDSLTTFTMSIMPVHLFGLCADMREINKFVRGRNIKVVEDAACALGSVCPAGTAGSMSDAGAFSFHPRKSITTGEGGMLTTNNKRIADEVGALRDFGFRVTNLERHQKGATIMPSVDILGYNYRMTDIQAAIGIEQMKKFDVILTDKKLLAAIYDQEFAGVGWLKTPHVPAGFVHTYQSYACLVRKTDKLDEESIEENGRLRNKVMGILKEKGIATRQGTHAVHMLDYYATKYEIKPMDYPNTFAADRMCLTIPLFPQMTDDERQYVIDNIKKIKV